MRHIIRQFTNLRAFSTTPSDDLVTEAVVIGAGAVGLAIANRLASRGIEVVVVDPSPHIASETSARNSGVIHAGIYYPNNSLKAKLCLQGKHLLYDFCARFNISHHRLGKLIVATDEAQIDHLKALQNVAARNGVTDLQLLTKNEALALEPHLKSEAALLSPSTGIIDVHGYVTELARQLEQDYGGVVALNTRVEGGTIGDMTFHTNSTNFKQRKLTYKMLKVRDVGSGEVSTIKSRYVVNSAGLWAQQVSRCFEGIDVASIPQLYLCKGNYFELAGKAPFSRLIYPLPSSSGLGIHLTLDMAGNARFGPDTEWIPSNGSSTVTQSLDYTVNPTKSAVFETAIREYYPDLQRGCLTAGYAGIRPKVVGPGQPPGDFILQGESVHGIDGMVVLYGIESPGLTASLGIAHAVEEILLGS